MATQNNNRPVNVVSRAEYIVARIKPLLAGLGPEAQGIVIADLLATYLAGHHPAVRDDALAVFLDCVRDLVGLNEQELFRDGKPEGWE